MNIAIFPMRDASPPLEVAFCGSVWCLRLEVAFCGSVWCLRLVLATVRMFSFPQTQIIVTTRLPALIYTPSAPSLYTAATVSMIGYTTYTFRCRGSDFLVRATETTTSRCRIISRPYNFFLLSPSKNTLPHSTNRFPVH